SETACQVGSVQIRNIATLAGNLCQSVKCPYYNLSHISLFMRRSLADCCKRGGKVCLALKADSLYHSILGKAVEGCIAPTPSDMAVPLMAADAEVSALSVKGERRIRLDEFYVGAGKTNLAPDEIITDIRVPGNGRRVGFVYKKYATSPRDVAVSNVAVKIELDQSSSTCADASVVLGGVAPAPTRAATAEQYLKGQGPSPEVLDECSRKALEGARTIGPKSFFKLRKTTVMLREALGEAFRAAEEAS
ncbi:MAG: FAD binding domain-containing protein, partial [Candidatus Bathyarchaeia archaeon]